MKINKILSLLVAISMLLSVGITAMAEETAVAKIGDTFYATLEAALKALKAGDTLTLLSDVTIDYKWDSRNTGGKIKNPVTIDGNGHKITVTNVVNDGYNYYSVFRFEDNATVKNLTIDMTKAQSEFSGRFRAISSKKNLTVEKCKFIGNGYANNTRAIIFGEGAGDALSDVAVKVTDSEFIGWRRAISDNEGGKGDAKSVVITGNKITDAEVNVSAAGEITFTNNIMNGQYVKITSYTDSKTVVVTATGNTLTPNAGSNMNFVDIESSNMNVQEGIWTPAPKVLPEAEVSNLGAITVTDKNGNGDLNFGDSYYVYDLTTGKLKGSSKESFDLDVAMKFVAKDSKAEAEANAYAEYTTDFFIKIDGLSNNFVGNGCYLAGYYPSYGIWVKIPLDGFTVEKDKTYPVITSVGFDYSYVDICSSVGEFVCGIYFTPEVIAANPGINVNLDLGLAETKEKAVNAEFEKVDGYTYDMEDLGYAKIPDLNGNEVIGKAPTATVNNLGAQTLPAGGYGIWDGKNYTSKGDKELPLSFVMQFVADQNAEDMKTSPYADWYADFVLTFDGLENDSFVADGCYLAGYYGDFGWVKVPVDGMKIEKGVRYPVMLGVGLGQKYDYICSGVKDFKCALYLTPEILAANPNLTVNLELAVVDNSKGEKAAAEAIVNNTNVYKVTDYNYVAKDFEVAKLFDFSGATVTLGNSMQISFFAKQEYFEGKDYYAVVEHYLPDGKINEKRYEFAEWEARKLSGVDYYVMNYSNLAAKQIADEIHVTIYKTDGTQVSNTKVDGLSAYAYRTIETTTNSELRTALVDMLNYGAATQAYFNYNTEKPANANAEKYQKYATADVSHLKNEKVSDSKYVGTTVTLENNIKLTGYFKNLTSDMYAVASFTDHYGHKKTLEVDGKDFYKFNSTTYGVCVDNLVVADAAQLVTITVYNADGTVYSTLIDSINGYLKRNIEKGDVYTAIAKFTTSAYNYLH